MGKAVKRVLAVLLTIILLVVVVVGCYIAYLMITYNRIADKQPIDIEVAIEREHLLDHRSFDGANVDLPECILIAIVIFTRTR